MNILIDLVKNPVFLSAGGAWLVAQGGKNIYEAIRYGFSKERLAGGNNRQADQESPYRSSTKATSQREIVQR